MMRCTKSWAAAAALLAMAGTTHAAFVNNGDGTITDTSTNLIWLQDWNVNGPQDWATQKAWAEGLTFAGSSDWVLPSISDYGTLFSEVGDLTLVSEFTNVLPDDNDNGDIHDYWSGTEFIPGFVWFFRPDSGVQDADASLLDQKFAVAVRPGDAAVPEPQSLALVLLALSAGAVAWTRRPL